MSTNEIYAVILALAAALTAGLIGAFALMKRMTLAADAISHIALPGLGLAILVKIDPLLGGATTLLLGTILIWHLEKRTGIATETMIGVVFSASLALGALITPDEKIIEAIFGGFSPITFPSFIIGLLAAAAILVFIVKYKDRLIINLFSQDLGTATGISAATLNLFYLIAFSATIVISLQFLGASLAGSLVIIPAATARRLTSRFPSFITLSSALSVVAVGAGLIIASAYNLSLGPTVISISALLFALSLFKTNG